MPLTLHARTPSAALTAMEGIKEYIRSNQLAPGDMLPSEATLCEQLGYSRSSVREAMRILSTLDIVEVRHGYGTYVSQMSLEPLVNGLIFRTVLEAERSFDGLIALVDAREALDISLGHQLIDALDEDTEEKLRGLAEKMRAQREQGEPFSEQDQEFHNELMSKVSNPLIQELTEAFRRVHTAVAPDLGLNATEHVHHTVESHLQILDALHAGDVMAYEEAVRRHYQPLRLTILEQAKARGFSA
ncbi:GntR family transcriptional regulator [Corynebacterium mastitidis]|uniref:GntR family transcriptional regulator n=1 Tax=Corynebacterium mastitidis TaxID=161890 RepID=A0ABU8NVA6_9CORY